MVERQTFRYLNTADEWTRFDERIGLTIDDNGRMRLAHLPGRPEIVGEIGTDPEEAIEPAGIDADEAGNIYLSDPWTHQVFRIDGCTGHSEPIAMSGVGRIPWRRPRHTARVDDRSDEKVVHRRQRQPLHMGLWTRLQGNCMASGAGPIYPLCRSLVMKQDSLTSPLTWLPINMVRSMCWSVKVGAFRNLMPTAGP